MDLIERLGGYDVVKARYQTLSDSDVITIGPFSVPAKPYFEEELLEHRREHNIYEEGDKVVMISKRRAPKLWTWTHTTNWRPNHSLLDCGENSLYPFSNDEFRHATVAEIKAMTRDAD